MESNPLVSILIPNFNKAPFLRGTLDSVLIQSYKNWECIIVDDHSTDNSWEILKEFARKDSRFKIYKRPDNRKKGGNAARNYAFELSKGDYINWLDSDDILFSNKIEKQLFEFYKSDNDFILSKFENENLSTEKNQFKFEEDPFLRPIKYIKRDFWFQTGIPLFRRDFLLLQDRLFDEELMRGQEEEFFVRILINVPQISFLDEVLLLFKNDPNSISHKFERKSEIEKANSDSFRFLHLFHLLKTNEMDNSESTNFFVDRFIYCIQYSSQNFCNLFNLLFICLLNGDISKKSLALKSFLVQVLKKIG